MILSTQATNQDYNTASQSLTVESRKWEDTLNKELYKMVYMQLYNRLQREKISKSLIQVISKMSRLKLW